MQDPRMQRSDEIVSQWDALQEDLTAVFQGELAGYLRHAALAIHHSYRCTRGLVCGHPTGNVEISALEIQENMLTDAPIGPTLSAIILSIQSHQGLHNVFPAEQREMFYRLLDVFSHDGEIVGMEASFRYLDTYYVQTYPAWHGDREKAYDEWLHYRSQDLLKFLQHHAVVIQAISNDVATIGSTVAGSLERAHRLSDVQGTLVTETNNVYEVSAYILGNERLLRHFPDIAQWAIAELQSDLNKDDISVAGAIKSFQMKTRSQAEQGYLFPYLPAEQKVEQPSTPPKPKRKGRKRKQ